MTRGRLSWRAVRAAHRAVLTSKQILSRPHGRIHAALSSFIGGDAPASFDSRPSSAPCPHIAAQHPRRLALAERPPSAITLLSGKHRSTGGGTGAGAMTPHCRWRAVVASSTRRNPAFRIGRRRPPASTTDQYDQHRKLVTNFGACKRCTQECMHYPGHPAGPISLPRAPLPHGVGLV